MEKVLKLMAVFALVAGVFCGGQEQAGQTGVSQLKAEVAFEELTQGEMDRFTAALPDVVEALKAADFKPEEESREDGAIAESLIHAVNSMHGYAGVEEALSNHSTNWTEFSATMFKVMAAHTAIYWELVAAMGQLSDEQLADGAVFCEQIPQENIQIVSQNMNALEPLGKLN